MFYFLDVAIPTTNDVQRNIIEVCDNNSFRSFPFIEGSSDVMRLQEWLDDDNELKEWQPEEHQ